MDWVTGVQKAIDYVENNLTDTIDFEEAAKRAYSSSFHFQRIFSIICGFTLGDYIRYRRLSLAGEELSNTKAKIIDVALKYDYNTPESFTRAFERFHGVKPVQAKKGANLKLFSRLSVKLILSGGSTMDYRIENLDKIKIVCKRKKFSQNKELTTIEISKFWQECTTDGTIPKICSLISAKPKLDGLLGISFSSELSNNEFPYGIGVEYNGESVNNKDFEVIEIPAHKYAVFTCKGKMPDAFVNTYKQICTEFFPQSGYEYAYGVEFEVYPSDDVKDPNYSCEIWVAVEKK